ncbi:hypothetical protein A3J90_04225 [candidate division WOR-1 bacterium RIFOXYC2_FULL_37_10]|uniref:VIT family protein n=1 Tax=candidate division WOR-1 bacterium RIFOXYB2_FULL_37_13 TaxID=1802579 RepID=A0A1F4SR92_UNCSA|nr:MAG: hypothetical protein A2246_02615 [candidate division WOR-1 bacterium RIFOXYA2_FULL_37_7]OGC22965.1 MAG: hypothetical protein A2310_04070 [candidate division WOR-1 bacterium RIFOXYB2_FULL_37_13]OGC34327.1 MAG: hypothetical protein A3J90_04225 [candidate division WOR-1 bacterium RIFOXYC2_FULL_37_10]
MFKQSFLTGLGFGLTSGIITTLGLMVGLASGTHSRIAVIGGVLTIAIADAFSDAMGIHMSEEAKEDNCHKDVWEATIATFFSKFIFASTFVIPLLLFDLNLAIYISIFWGLLLLSLFSLFIAKSKGDKPFRVILEHLCITFVVLLATYFVGVLVSSAFGNT